MEKEHNVAHGESENQDQEATPRLEAPIAPEEVGRRLHSYRNSSHFAAELEEAFKNAVFKVQTETFSAEDIEIALDSPQREVIRGHIEGSESQMHPDIIVRVKKRDE